jgi:hypothetical protein
MLFVIQQEGVREAAFPANRHVLGRRPRGTIGEAGIRAIERAIRILDAIPIPGLKAFYDFIIKSKQADAYFSGTVLVEENRFYYRRIALNRLFRFKNRTNLLKRDFYA